jgi:hypothetical protein
MSIPSEADSLRELQELVDQLLDGQLSSAECQRLEQLVCSSQACSDFYFRAMQLTAGLSRGAMPPIQLGQLTSEDSAGLVAEVAALSAQVEALAEMTLTQTPGTANVEMTGAIGEGQSPTGCRAAFPALDELAADSSWIHYPKFIVLFGLLAIFVGGVGGWLVSQAMLPAGSHSELARNGDPSSTTMPAVTPAAYLTMSNGCSWGPQGRTVGSSVELGDEITLQEGIAEFRLSSGVSLSIEGPTTLVMASSNSLVLQHGKLTAYVPWAVSDFRLITPACRLTASDAEFGVYASGGQVDIHTFSGEVRAVADFQDSQAAEVAVEREQNLTAGSEFLATTITAGRGLALVNQGYVTKVSRWHSADKDNFATKLTMAGPLPITRQYVDSVMASNPISYWRFESIQDGFIPNEIGKQASLKIFGDLRLTDDSANRVAELGRPGSDGYLLSEDGLTFPSAADYSVELWLKPSHLHSGTPVVFLADFAKDRKERAAFLLALLGTKHDPGISQRYPGKIRFLHRNPPGPSVTTGTSCFSSSIYALRRWQHVVATKEKGEMRLFVDGTLVATGKDKSPQASNVHVLVGQLSTAKRLFPLIGQLDELAIYDRALSQDEISKRLKILKWQPELKTVTRDNDS